MIGISSKQKAIALHNDTMSCTNRLFASLADYSEAEKNSLLRVHNKNISDLADMVCNLENQEHAIITTSGMMSVNVVLQSLCKAGDHILVADDSYSIIRDLCSHMTKFGVEVTFFNPSDLSNLHSCIRENTVMIFFEVAGSDTFKIPEIDQLVSVAKSHNIPVVCDNTWSTVLGFDASSFGIDIVVASMGKYLAGRNDMLMGYVACGSKYIASMLKCCARIGCYVTGADCMSMMKGMRSVEHRMRHHSSSALLVAEFLDRHDMVSAVYCPALASSSENIRWRKYFKGGSGSISFSFKEKYTFEQLETMLNNLECFFIGNNSGGDVSMIKYLNAATPGLVCEGSAFRLFCGADSPDVLIGSLSKAFEVLHSVSCI